MPLAGKTLTGMPEWIGQGFEYASKTGDTADMKKTTINGVNLEFSTDDLFNTEVKAPAAMLRGFFAAPFGDKEDPNIDLIFNAYVNFTRDLWQWCGEFGGKQFWAKFEQVEVEAEPTEEPEDEEEADEVEEEDENQMRLIAPPEEIEAANPGEKDEVPDADDSEITVPPDCGYVDGKGNRCILAEHETGEHQMAPITQAAEAAKPIRRPRGFSKSTNSSVM